jgi:hypothetical protein
MFPHTDLNHNFKLLQEILLPAWSVSALGFPFFKEKSQDYDSLRPGPKPLSQAMAEWVGAPLS